MLSCDYDVNAKLWFFFGFFFHNWILENSNGYRWYMGFRNTVRTARIGCIFSVMDTLFSTSGMEYWHWY